MRPICLKYLLVLTACAALPRCLAGENLVPNSDFKDGLKHWKVAFKESNETKYHENDQWVSVEDKLPGGERGSAIKFELNASVAASEGVKAVTGMLKIDPTKTYAFGAKVYSAAPSQIIFVEGYQKDPDHQEAGSDQYPGYVRVYRATIHVKAKKNTWETVSRLIKAPKAKRYQPSYLLIKLYAYHPPGTCYFRDVFLEERPGEEPPARKK